MSDQTKPFFVLSSGRSGTQLMEVIFRDLPDVEMHHEYLCTHVQPLTVRYYMGLASFDEVRSSLGGWYKAALALSPCRLWGDSSNKLSWAVPVLESLFPDARYIHLVRDGRKVASSFLHKLGNECYDDRSTAALWNWSEAPERHPMPPPEKKYWWEMPPRGAARREEFAGFDQFRRICFHWGEVNRWLLRDLARVPPARRRCYRLEDLTVEGALAEDFFRFLDIEPTAEMLRRFETPHNVNIPRDFPLSDAERDALSAEAGDVMAYFGYDKAPEYRVDYDRGKNRGRAA